MDANRTQNAPTEAPPLRFFDGFSWAVPTAFAGALAAHRFEQGDVLFRDPEAYETLVGSIPQGSVAIQVLHPPRSARTTPADVEGDRRLSSWQSDVQIEVIDLTSGARQAHTISQGKLLMTLWDGDERWLDPGHAEPPLPRTSRELAGELSGASAAFANAQETKQGCRFVFVVDLSSDASRVKAQTVEEALAALGPVEQTDLRPAAAGVEAPETFHPALVIRGLAVSGATPEAAEVALKARLYGRQATDSSSRSEAADASSDPHAASDPDAAAPKADRFSIARHGLLEPIVE